ncbi:MAG: class I SAM-dependent methyltransferase [Lachnospiraceae bacterium]|nr:class I SAM-dependent methyltransferase [Lachnospiraceae bacterium]
MSYWRNRFLKYIPDGGRILDAGCGSGRDSKAFIGQGYSVVAFDASREMCKKAAELLGQEVWQMRFDEMAFEDEFDGVWACASLLHVSENEIDDAIQRIKTSLSDNGILYASFKYGDGTTEKHERSFLNYTEETIQEMMEREGFEILECEISLDIRPDRKNEKWINVIVKI